MFNRFSRRKKQGRGFSEDPAAPFLITRSTQRAEREMVDYALIDQAVNEWMSDASKEKAVNPPSVPALSTRVEAAKPSARTHDTGIRRGLRQMAGIKPLESKPLLHPVLHRADQTPLSQADKSRLDRVLLRAYAAHLIAPEMLHEVLSATPDTSMDWRTVAQRFPELAHTLGRLAADTYGFRSVLICQMGTLVLADLLTMRIPALLWRPMFETGMVPVVEHGVTPDPNQRIICASHDPSSIAAREFLQGVKSFRPEPVYADEGHTKAVMEMIAQHIPLVGAQVRMLQPDVVQLNTGTPTAASRPSPRAA